jgi:TP901 family phage tail tape measure protein
MADVTKTVQVIFGAKNEVSQIVDQIGRDFDNIGKNLTSVTGPLDEITDKVLMAEAAFATLALAGMGYAIQAAGQFNGKFGEITTLIKDTGAPIDQFKKDILDYSTSSVKSIEQINQSIYNAISAGVDYKDSIAFINEAEKLSVAGRSGLDVTTKVLISTLNAYGASTNQAGKYSDLMFTTVRLGQTTMEELSSSLAMVTGLASTAGIPFSTLSAAIAALTVAGLPTAQAITGIRQAIDNIIKPSGEAEKMAAKLGIQFNATALQTKGFEGVLMDAYRATNGNIGKMTELFGSVESLNAVMILGADKTGKFKEALTEMGKSAGATSIAYGKVAEEFENINQRLSNSFKATVIDIGQKLLPQYGNIAAALGDLMKGVRVGIDAGTFDPLFKYLDQVGKSIADWIRAVAHNFPEAMKDIDFYGLIKSLEGLGGSIGDAFKSIFGNIDLETPEGLHQVIQRIINGLAALTNVTKGVIDGMQPLFKLIGEGIDKFQKMDESSAGLIGNILGVAKSINILADYSAQLTAVLSILTGKALLDVTLSVVRLGATMAGAIPGLAAYVGAVGTLGAGATFGVAGAATALSLMTGALLNQIPIVQQGSQSLLGLIDVNKDFFGVEGASKDAVDSANKNFDAAVLKHKQLSSGTGETTTATEKFNKATREIDLASAKKAFDDLNTSLKKTRDDLEAAEKIKKLDITIEVQADGTSIETTKEMIIKYFPDGTVFMTNIGTRADEARLAETKKKIDDAIPKEKLLEIQATLDVAKIKAMSDEVQKAIEWRAKIDIADIEANAKIVEALAKSISETFSSTGTTLVGLFGALTAMQGKGGTSLIEQTIADENRRRDETLAMLKKLNEAEIDNLKARTALLDKGESIIKIEGAGLQPHLEAFMYEILKAIQVRATAEGVKFLVGA